MLKRNGWLAAMLAAVCVLAAVADAQDKSIRRLEPGRLMALVIGNAAYAEAPLKNPVNDARAVAGVLREKLGFAEENVELLENLASHEELTLAVENFGKGLRATDLVFFYYSGHGRAVERENYLLPTGFGAGGQVEDGLVRFRALAESEVRAALEQAQLRVIVLDACRNSPYGSKKSPTQGLVKAGSTTQGELLAYATGEGMTATDEGDGTGVYARHLVAELQEPGVEFRRVFDQVANAVYAATKGKQQPEAVYKLLGAEFYFLPRNGSEVSETGSGTGGGGVDRPLVADRVTDWVTDWQALEPLEKSKDPDGVPTVKEYINKYKGEDRAGVWVKRAERLLAKLEGIAAGTDGPTGSRVQKAGSSWKSPSGMEFAWIPAGEFLMGSPSHEKGRDNDERQHGVRISEGFWIGKYEVTQEEWEAVMGSNPSHFESCRPQCPVESVSWKDVQGFIQKLNEDEREAGSGNRYRLPTEAEWEYAARAGSAGATPEGDLRILGKNNAPVLDGQAWYAGNSGVSYAGAWDCSGWEERQNGAKRCGPHPVGLKKANGWGLHDMLGNVWEWVADWYDDYPSGVVTDPRGPSTGSYRVLRGGGWISYARAVRSAYRIHLSPGRRDNRFGFRLVRTE